MKKTVDEIDSWEEHFDKISIEERSKTDEETLFNVEGIKISKKYSKNPESCRKEYIVVCKIFLSLHICLQDFFFLVSGCLGTLYLINDRLRHAFFTKIFVWGLLSNHAVNHYSCCWGKTEVSPNQKRRWSAISTGNAQRYTCKWN